MGQRATDMAPLVRIGQVADRPELASFGRLRLDGKFRPTDPTINRGPNRSISGPEPATSEPIVAPHGNPGPYLTDA